MANVGIIGAGDWGANLALFLVEQKIANVFLCDDNEDRAKGKSLDLLEAAPPRHYHHWVTSRSELQGGRGCDLICITSDYQKGKSLAEQEMATAQLISRYATELSSYPAVVMIACEPSDLMTSLFLRKSGLPSSRVMGTGTYLQSFRLKRMIAERLDIVEEDISATILGRDNQDMILSSHLISVSGLPLRYFLSESEEAELYKKLRNNSRLLSSHVKPQELFYSNVACVANMVASVLGNYQKIMNVSHHRTHGGQTNQADVVALGFPAVVGSRGIERDIALQLNGEEQEQFTRSEEELSELVKKYGGQL